MPPLDWRIVAAALAVLVVLGGGTLLGAQVQNDLDQGVEERVREYDRGNDAPPLKLNEFKIPSDLPMQIPPGTEISPDLSRFTIPDDLDLQLPSDLDLSDLDFELPEDFSLELPEGTVFSPPGLQLPNGGTIRLPDGRAFELPPGSKLDLPPEVVERLLQQGLPAGELGAQRSLDMRDLPPDLTARLDPPQFDGAGSLRLPGGTTITLPDGRRLPFPAGALAYGARYLLPAGSRIDLPFSALDGQQGAFPVPRPNSRAQLVDAQDGSASAVFTEITGLPPRVRKGEPVTVSGYVRDAAGRGVVGAPVDVFMNETKRAPGVLVGQGRSDGTGTFVIQLKLPDDKPAREYQLVNHAVAFTDASGRAWADGWGDPPFATFASTTLKLDLPARDGLGASTPIAGSIVDHTGTAVAGVTVVVSVDGTVVARPVTDALGRFSTTHGFSAGTHLVEARFLGTPSYEASAVRGSITIEDYAIEIAPTLRAQPGDTLLLTGRVLGKGAAAPERIVTISLFGTSARLASDASGRFSYAFATSPAQAPGAYTITYALPEHNVVKPQAVELNLTGRLKLDAPASWDVDQAIPVGVALSGDGGEPLAGHAVRLILTGPGGSTDSVVHTDGGGGATILLRPLRAMPGAYTLTARAAGNPYLDAPAVSTSIALARFEVLWSVPSTVVRGQEATGAATVRLGDQPYANAALTLDFFGPIQLITDARGRATWGRSVPAEAWLGEHTLSMQAADHPMRTTVTNVVAIPTIEMDVPSSFEAGEPVRASLRLRDDAGVPLGDVPVTLVTVAPEGVVRTTVRTNSDGRWSGALNLSDSAGNVTLSARVEPEGPYLGADTSEVMSATAPRPFIARGGWLAPLLVGLAVVAGGGAWYASKKLPRKAAPAPLVVAPDAPIPLPSEMDVRFAIPAGEPAVWGVGEPLGLVARNLGDAGELDLAWPGGSSRLRLAAGAEASSTLTFPEEGEVEARATRVAEGAVEAATASVRIVDYRKEIAREFDVFLEKARAIDGSLTKRSTPREIGWTLEARLGRDAQPSLDEIALVMEVANYSHYEVSRAHYLRFVAAARALEGKLASGNGG